MMIGILFLVLFSYSVTAAADVSQSQMSQSVVAQQTFVETRKTWTCSCYSRCFTRICKRFGVTPIIPVSTHDDAADEPSAVRNRAASRADIELRKRGSSSAADRKKFLLHTRDDAHAESRLPIHAFDGPRLSPLPNPSYEPLPGLSLQQQVTADDYA